MIGVISTHELEGREKSIYERILRYTKHPEQFQLLVEGEVIPPEIKTILLLDGYDSYLTKQFTGRTKLPIGKARGYRYKSENVPLHITVIPTYAPSILNGKMNWFPVVVFDFKQALEMDGCAPPVYPLDELELNPSPRNFELFCYEAKSSEFITVDLETPTEKDEETDTYATTILRASMAYYKDGQIRAITFPWIEPYISEFVSLMATDVPKVFWNGWRFDQPILMENKIPINGRIYDAMWLYHFLQPTLPKSLGAVSTIYCYVPEWKSLNNDEPELYSAMDAWATAKNFLGIRASLQKRGTWDLAERHVTDLLYILEAMSDRGIAVSLDAIQKFNEDCDAKLAALQEELNNHPELKTLRNYHPKEGYKKTPKDTTGMVEIPVCLADREWDGSPLPTMSGSAQYERRWAKHEDFLPSSHEQVKKYLDSKGYSYGGSTNEKVLSSLARKYKDPLLKKFIAYRDLVKKKGTYGGIPIGADGRVHTTFTLRPDTHRLSSINPNLQNQPGYFKHVFVASPGHKLLEADLSSVEAVITGFLAGDPEYIRRAKIGIHKIAMAIYLGEEIDFSASDDEIKAIVKDIKDRDEKLYRKIKVIIYGGNYLAGPKTIYESNSDDFASQKEAKEFLRFCQSLSPKIPAWQKRTTDQAQTTHGLTNGFGYFKGFWGYEDGPAACAFMPQSTVAAIMKEIMLELAGTWVGQYMVLQVHDSLVFDIPEDLVEAAKPVIEKAFTRVWAELGGMSLGYEVKVGDTLDF